MQGVVVFWRDGVVGWGVIGAQATVHIMCHVIVLGRHWIQVVLYHVALMDRHV